MRRKLTVSLLASLILFSVWQLTVNVSAQQSLSLAMVLTGLQTKGSTPETATLAKRNVYIQRKVETYGVTFRVTTDIEQELRNAGATPVLIAAIRRNGPSAPSTPTPRPTTSSKASATFDRVWVDYDVTEGGKKGMRIHLKFTTYGLQGVDSSIRIYFQTKDGTNLKDNNKSFYSQAGYVAVFNDIKPGYDPASYSDLQTFMPYEELDLSAGSYNLKMDIDLILEDGTLVQHLAFHEFDYNQPSSDEDKVDPSTVSFKVNRIWVDYDINQGGERGMKVHVNFEVTGLKGVSSYLGVRIMKENGDILRNNSSSYSNSDGEFEVPFSMEPGYATTVYKDADVFIPYDEIKISRGKWRLSLDVDLRFADGELIKHMDTYAFEFTQP